MKWLFKVIAGGARALIPVPLLAAFMVLAVASAQASNIKSYSDSAPLGGPAEHEVQIIVASMPPTVDNSAVGSVICNATVSIEVFDVKKLGGEPVAALTDARIAAGESLSLTHPFEPGVGDRRQDVVVRVTLTPEPNIGMRFAAHASICSFIGSAQTIDRATGDTIDAFDIEPFLGPLFP